MRNWINLIEDVLTGFHGCWIEPDGTVHHCSHDTERHHDNIAIDVFGKDNDRRDEWEHHDRALQHAMDAHWMRVSAISSMGFSVNWNGRATDTQYTELKPILSSIQDKKYDRYYIEHNTKYLSFDDYYEFMAAIKSEIRA